MTSAPEPHVAVVVLNWNGWQDTACCLEALSALTYTNRRVVVVDNGSTDDSVSRLTTLFPSLRVVETGRNLGFAGGTNVALAWLREQEPDYVWLLNNDTQPAPEALSALVDLAGDEPRLGAVGSLLVGEDGGDRLQACGGRVSFWTGLARHNRRIVAREQIDYLVGASLLVRWRALRDVGPLDERFFLYWEDTDLSFRLRAAGWGLAVAANSLVPHRSSASLRFQSATWDREFTASSIVFFRRHAVVPWLPIAVSVSGRIARRAARGRWRNARATWDGFRQGSASLQEARGDSRP